MKIIQLIVSLIVFCIGGHALANAHAQRVKHRGIEYDVFKINPPFNHLNIHWRDRKKDPYLDFHALKIALGKRKRRLIFACNAGIFAPRFKPLGLHVENYRTIHPVNHGRGPGNFYVQPNGIFMITRTNRARIILSKQWNPKKYQARIATQSGPMLVINNRIFWKLRSKSPSVYIRNGVGIDSTGAVYFAISRSPVNMHQFAHLFRYRLNCPWALYLDGSISKMYLPRLKRYDSGGPFAAMFSYSLPNR